MYGSQGPDKACKGFTLAAKSIGKPRKTKQKQRNQGKAKGSQGETNEKPSENQRKPKGKPREPTGKRKENQKKTKGKPRKGS